MEEIIYTKNPVEFQPFFDFEFEVLAWQLIKTTLNQEGGEKQVLDPCIWASLFLVKQKYDDKNEKMKRRKKMFEEKQKHYMEAMEKRKEHEKKLLWHIAYTEKACGEKQRLLNAIGMIAHNVKKMNEA